MTDAGTTAQVSATGSDVMTLKLGIFEGPLDLLLYLVRRNEVDIYDIPMETITRQYLEHLEAMQQLNVEVASEFIAVAAQLLYIKSRLLLPEDERLEEEDNWEDPRLELVQMLLEYKQFKEVAEQFAVRYVRQESSFPRGADVTWDTVTPENTVGSANIFDLCEVFKEACKKIRQDVVQEIFPDRFSVEDKIAAVRESLREGEALSFDRFLSADPDKLEVVCLFLALLELTKLQEIRVLQDGRIFGTLTLQKRMDRESWTQNLSIQSNP